LVELSNFQADSSEHESVVTGFEAKVSDIAQTVAEAAEGRSPDNVAERLYGALADTRGADTKRRQVPVIVDDLLVQFDDDRAVATLEVLSELSAKTQVLFFTHHKHLVELAEASKLAAAISVQRL
jgi:hypothetical protein